MKTRNLINDEASSSQSSLEDTLKAFMQIIGQAIERLVGQFDRLVTELNRMEKEEFQSQLMVERYYMIDENESSNPHHEHAHATTTISSEEVVEEIVNEPSLEDPLEESFAHLEFDLDLDMIHEQAEALLDSTPENDLTMGKPLRYHSLTHFHQQLRRKRKRSTWSLLRTWSKLRPH
jgi:hypothetical protein